MLRLSRATLALFAGLFLLPPAAAQEAALDLVPDDAAFALVVKSIEGLQKKGEQFFEAHDVDPQRAPRPSRLFDQLFDYLKLKEGVDRQGPAALLLPNLQRLGLQVPGADPFAFLMNLVVVVPITDADTVGKNFGFEKGKLAPGKTMSAGDKFVRVEGKKLYLGLTEKAVNVYAQSKPVTKELNPAQKKALTGSDVVLHFGPQVWGKAYKGLLDDLKRGLAIPMGDKTDDETAEQFVAALGEVRFVVGGLTLGGAPSIDVVASFLPGADGATALKFLRALRAGPGASDLNGLPKVEPMVLFAAKGDGERNVHMARALLKLMLDKAFGITVQITEEDRKKFLAAFDVMYQHLKGSRSVIYRTDARVAGRVGETAGVVILDVDDTTAHLGQWERLVEVANNAAPKILKQDRQSSPKFVFKPKAEMLDGMPVDMVVVEVPGLPPEVEAGYKKLMGPDWNKLRMVVVGKQIVGLFGSDVETLKQTVANVKNKEKGLAAAPAVAAALGRLSPERKVEMHFNLASYVPFLAGGKAAGPVKDLTSLALTVEEDRVQFEIKAGKDEVTQIVKQLGLGK